MSTEKQKEKFGMTKEALEHLIDFARRRQQLSDQCVVDLGLVESGLRHIKFLLEKEM